LNWLHLDEGSKSMGTFLCFCFDCRDFSFGKHTYINKKAIEGSGCIIDQIKSCGSG